MSSDFRQAYEKIRPSIVGIGYRNDPEFKIFGTGFLIDSSGWIMTNRHVLEPLLTEGQNPKKVGRDAAAFLFIRGEPTPPFVGAAGVMATSIREIRFTNDEVKAPQPPFATFRGRQPRQVFVSDSSDIGFCKIDPNDCPPEALPLQPAMIADSNGTTEGTPVGILGFPQGVYFPRKFRSVNDGQFTPLLQTGVISGVLPFSGLPRPDAFVLDMYVNPGSSGSPLFTTEGVVIGIVFATRRGFSPLVRFKDSGQTAESKEVGIFLPSALGLAVPSASFFSASPRSECAETISNDLKI